MENSRKEKIDAYIKKYAEYDADRDAAEWYSITDKIIIDTEFKYKMFFRMHEYLEQRKFTCQHCGDLIPELSSIAACCYKCWPTKMVND